MPLHIETLMTCDDNFISWITLSAAIIDFLLVTPSLFGTNHYLMAPIVVTVAVHNLKLCLP